MRRDQVKTPALILDLDALDRNIATMAARAKTLGVALRPHAKSHKCAEIARRLAAAGANGPGCATIGEAEAMAAAGIGGILVTSPMSTPDMLERVRRLLLRGADLTLVADDPRNVDALAVIAAGAARPLPILVELDVGVGRTGCIEVADAVALAQRIAGDRSLRFAGIQAYWGNLQQVAPLDERERRVAAQIERTRSLVEALTSAGLKPGIVSGSGTGTHWIDGRSGIFTELQPGSFLFLDSCYIAVALAQRIAGDRSLHFAGIQAYWGNLQQVAPFDERERRVAAQVERTRSLVEALTSAGLKPGIVSGSGTGTHWIDGRSGIFTELQPGSFLFLDSCYIAVAMSAEGNPFIPALFVAASVVTSNRPDRVIVNAGWKAFATDSGKPVPMRGAPAGAIYRYMGDEHGAVEFENGAPPPHGAVIELLTSHCDPTVNLHARYQVVRGDEVVDEWPILARGY